MITESEGTGRIRCDASTQANRSGMLTPKASRGRHAKAGARSLASQIASGHSCVGARGVGPSPPCGTARVPYLCDVLDGVPATRTVPKSKACNLLLGGLYTAVKREKLDAL